MLSEIWEMWEGLFSIENLKCSHQLSPGLGLAEGTTCTAHHGPGRPGETPKTFQLDGSHQKSVNKKFWSCEKRILRFFFFFYHSGAFSIKVLWNRVDTTDAEMLGRGSSS